MGSVIGSLSRKLKRPLSEAGTIGLHSISTRSQALVCADRWPTPLSDLHSPHRANEPARVIQGGFIKAGQIGTRMNNLYLLMYGTNSCEISCIFLMSKMLFSCLPAEVLSAQKTRVLV